ncbi:hypothetical protein Ahia01_000292500, partial [Argonauta hians]
MPCEILTLFTAKSIPTLCQAFTVRLCFEIMLVGMLIKLFIKTRRFNKLQLTEEEKLQVIEDWTPEPLVPSVSDDNKLIVRMNENVVHGQAGKIITINGRECINMATFNFLNLLGDKSVEKESIKRLQFYGVGTCGPRGFYGTTDTHLECEERFCDYMNTEMAVLYSHGFLTVTSAIATYSKRNDVIFCDMGASFAVTQGLRTSRSKYYFFRHNDMEHLEELLIEHQRWEKQNPKKAKTTKKLIVVEGIYLNSGDICPLPRIVELRDIYKVRVMVDESFSFGILGPTGRGITEHYGLSVDDIDVFTANLENTFASVGGLSVGKKWVLDKQRMGSLGYAFSASQPPLCVAAIIHTINILEENNKFVSECRQTCEMVQQKLSGLNGFRLDGLPFSPVKHLFLSESSGDRETDYDLLQRIVLFV